MSADIRAVPRWRVISSVHADVMPLVGTSYGSVEEVLAAVATATPDVLDYVTTAVRYGDDTTICVYVSEARARTCAARWGAMGGGADTLIRREGIPARSPVPGQPGRTGHRIETL